MGLPHVYLSTCSQMPYPQIPVMPINAWCTVRRRFKRLLYNNLIATAGRGTEIKVLY